MKKLVSLLILLVQIGICYGQAVDYNKIILPDNAKDVSIEERLVQIAWKNNPASAMAKNNVSIAEYQLKRVQWSWLDHVTISGNLNEFTIKGRDEENPQSRNNFYPRYNIGASFRLSSFAQTPLDVKVAREQVQNSNELVNQLKLQLRADVLKRYNAYKASLDVYTLQSEAFRDLDTGFKLTEEKFDKGEASTDQYNAARERRDGQRLRMLNAEQDYLMSKIDLEELLGLKVEEIL